MSGAWIILSAWVALLAFFLLRERLRLRGCFGTSQSSELIRDIGGIFSIRSAGRPVAEVIYLWLARLVLIALGIIIVGGVGQALFFKPPVPVVNVPAGVAGP
jgi:hypothetical protein